MRFVKSRFPLPHDAVRASEEDVRLTHHAYPSSSPEEMACAIWVSHPWELDDNQLLCVFLHRLSSGSFRADLVVVSHHDGGRVGRLHLGSILMGGNGSFRGSDSLAGHDDLRWNVYGQAKDLIRSWCLPVPLTFTLADHLGPR